VLAGINQPWMKIGVNRIGAIHFFRRFLTSFRMTDQSNVTLRRSEEPRLRKASQTRKIILSARFRIV
jgi:hypothetical protein